MQEIKGYKAFNKDATNRYGQVFIEGETYYSQGKLQFGNNGNGFHMCTALSDVFRFVNALDDEVLVAEVTGSGNYVLNNDFYYGYFDMYCFEMITINKFLSREEIINKMLASPSYEVKKFFSTCRLNRDEKFMFVKEFMSDIDVIKALLYYHFDCHDIYQDSVSVSTEEQLRKVLKYGQNNC